MPWDLAAANSEAGAQKQLGNSVASLQANWLRTQQEYGLEGSWADAASNPFSRAAALQRSYDNAKRGTLNSAGHKLYGGSYLNAQNQNTRGFNEGQDQLQKTYAAARAQNLAEQQEAQDRYNEELAEAAWNRVNAGLEGAPEPMPYGAPPGPGGKGKPKRPPKQPQRGPAVGNRQAAIAANISRGRKAR